MKKIITLLLLIGGFACAANATTLHVGIEIPYYSGSVNIYRYGGSTPDVWNNAPSAIFDGLKYGRYWYHIDMNGNVSAVIRVSDGQSEDITGISGDEYYVYMSGTKDNAGKYPVGHLDVDYDRWNNGLTCRNNIDNNWSSTESNMIQDTENPNLFTRTFTPTQIGESTEIIFRIKQNDYVPLNTDGASLNGYPQIYPQQNDAVNISIGSYTTTFDNYIWEDGNNRIWKIFVPDYAYKEIVVSVEYIKNGNNYTWKISADAYVSVTTNASGYCTYTVAVPLTISGATAYYATDNGNGSATAHAMTNPAANVPMLIKGDPSTTYSFAVAASGTDSPSDNAFKAGTGGTLESGTGPYNYILNGNAFYAANGRTVAVGKAYLQLSAAASSRALVFADDEATGINVVETSIGNANACYNLSGQRVANPQKGLYIVNGRKVVLK